MMKSRRFGVGGVLIVAVAAVIVVADAFAVPSWRGQAGTTMQQWSFAEPNYGPVKPDAGWNNGFGTPFLWVGDRAQWSTGAWTLITDEIDVVIPNDPQLRPQKQICIELTWKPAAQSFLPDSPLVGVATEIPDERIEITRQDGPPVNGWTTTTFNINIWPNPPSEWIAIKGDVFIDQVVIDTYCMPEPATLLLLGLGGLLGLKRKKNL